MKLKTLVFSAILALPFSGHAASVTIGTGGARGHQILLSDGTTRAAIAGSTVRIGYLTTPGESSTFVSFGSSAISNPLSTALIGGFINTSTPDSATASAGNSALSVIAGKQLAIWVTGNNGDQGLFTSTSWAVPGTLGTASDQAYNLVLGAAQGAVPGPPTVTAIAITGFNDGAVALGTITVTTGSNTNGLTYKLGAAVPEPSSLILLSLLGVVGLRRKR